MQCGFCGQWCDAVDNYCRFCGTGLRSARLPVPRAGAAIIPWQQARPALVRGIAALLVGTAFELLRREVARRLTDEAPRERRLARKAGGPGDEAVAPRVVETVYVRRTWFW